MNIYVIYIDEPGLLAEPCIKIGIAADIKSRMAAIQTSCPFTILLYRSFEVPDGNASIMESLAHKKLKKFNTRGEWFLVTPNEGAAVVEQVINNFAASINDDVRTIPAITHPIYRARITRNLKLKDVAAALGTDTGNISRIEKGQQFPAPDLLLKLIEYFPEVSADEVLRLHVETKKAQQAAA